MRSSVGPAAGPSRADDQSQVEADCDIPGKPQRPTPCSEPLCEAQRPEEQSSGSLEARCRGARNQSGCTRQSRTRQGRFTEDRFR